MAQALTQFIICALAWAGYHACISRCYQARAAAATVYAACMCAGVSLVVSPWLTLLVPVVWLTMAIHIYCLSWRTFTASLLGFLTAPWICLAAALAIGNLGANGDIGGIGALETFGEQGVIGALGDAGAIGDEGPLTPHFTLHPSPFTLPLFLLLAIIAEVRFRRHDSRTKIRCKELHRARLMLFGALVVMGAIGATALTSPFNFQFSIFKFQTSPFGALSALAAFGPLGATAATTAWLYKK